MLYGYNVIPDCNNTKRLYTVHPAYLPMQTVSGALISGRILVEVFLVVFFSVVEWTCWDNLRRDLLACSPARQ